MAAGVASCGLVGASDPDSKTAGRRPCWSMCWRVRKHGRRSMASDNLTVSTNSTMAGVKPVTSLARSVMLMNRSRMGTVATMRTK